MSPLPPEGHGIRLVCLDFQAPPRTEASLSKSEALAVATEAFPRSLPVSVRDAGPFRALKLFPAGACVGVSHVFDGGAVDDWDRPVLSARIALVRPAARNAWGRDVAAIAEALAGLEAESEGCAAAADAVAAHLDAAGLLRDRERFARAVKAAGVPFLGRVVHACAVASDVVLVAEDTPEARQVLSLALALLPTRRLAALRACTSCTHAGAAGREEVVLLPRAPEPARRSLMSRVTGRPGPDDRVVIDLASRAAPEVRGGPYPPSLFTAALGTLAEAEPWPGLDFPAWHAQILACVEALWEGTDRALLKDAADISKEHGERMKALLSRLSS